MIMPTERKRMPWRIGRKQPIIPRKIKNHPIICREIFFRKIFSIEINRNNIRNINCYEFLTGLLTCFVYFGPYYPNILMKCSFGLIEVTGSRIKIAR